MISVGDAMSDTVRTLVAAALISFMSYNVRYLY